ncbi:MULTISPECIES: ABC transporter ATP-binding protein [Prauserella salsuginis group]|uniref:ABC transporter ATP-binding protein n=1 Tax=Prauserella salsuginis TaxID=387889 RepID=A0ABW6FYY0_9PSEU|nr:MULTISPECIES: betaine/proline/choline family ABC transporter ATP-binding protein [Prauserella salsuginis group]MCR3720326.1 osmoprotectant transport system ATP-binding protein [Prauserella flava]MCR3733965.1 osmoprotectant transport system ATP-binding protein [Prauserella salsuginis]
MTSDSTDSAVSGVEIQLEGVTKRYPGSAEPAVKDVTMTIPAGQIVVLVGPSGCGKTTTMRMINRLIEPTSGRITIGGEDALELDDVRLRRKIGYAIQQAGLFPHFTVAQNIAVVPGLLGWDKKRIAERVDELMDLVGLDASQFRDRYPRQLSGGQQQRVGVARALAADPPVLLMDEPFGAVDPITRGNLQDELLRLQADLGKTIVFVTHDFDEAVKLGDRIAVLGEASTIQQYDTPEAILANPANDMVAGFVGAGASLKQLTLLRVRDVDYPDLALTADVGESPSELRARLARAGDTYALLVDRRRRPQRWVHVRNLSAATSLANIGRPVGDTVSTQSTLQDALEAILAEGGRAVVTGTRGEYVGMIDIETVTGVLAQLREEHESAGDAGDAGDGVDGDGTDAADGDGHGGDAGRAGVARGDAARDGAGRADGGVDGDAGAAADSGAGTS